MSRQRVSWRSLVAASGVVGVLVGAGCGDGRPEGWNEESHGKSAPARYDKIFTEEVQRLDITIAPEDWQAMKADLEEKFGQPGGGPGPGPGPGPTFPPEAITACEGKEDGSECSYSAEGMQATGRCRQRSEQGLACMAYIVVGPGPGGGPGGGPGTGEGPSKEAPIYVPSTVHYDGRTWTRVGIRFKGNSTLGMSWSAGTAKMPLRLDFDELEDRYPEIEDQRFWGFKQLSFFNGAKDSSLLREKVATDLFREEGLPAAATAFYRVYLDVGEGPVYAGLYTITEVPGEPLLERHFGDDSSNLYKPEGKGADWVTFQREGFEKKTNEEAADWSDVEAAIAALHADRGDAARWRAELEARFDVDGFLHVLALNTVMLNWDMYGAIAHNYFLYGDPRAGGRLVWIPWDHNEALNAGQYGPMVTLMHDEKSGERWPLIRYLLDDPTYRAAYLNHVQGLLDGVFAIGPLQERLRAEHARISPYVVGPEGEQPGYTLLRSPDEFEQEHEALLQWVERRHTEVRTQLEALR